MLVHLAPQTQFLGHSGVLHVSAQDFHLPCFLKAQPGASAPVAPPKRRLCSPYTSAHPGQLLEEPFSFLQAWPDLQQCSLNSILKQE